MKSKKIQHLYWRAGFGIELQELKKLDKKPKQKIIKELFSKSQKINTIHLDFSLYEKNISQKYKKSKKRTPEQRKEIQKYLRTKGVELNSTWINTLNNTDTVLREKMTLFWANVFVCADNDSWLLQKYNNTLRNYALGNFGDFVKAISHEASMIKYLNTKQKE